MRLRSWFPDPELRAFAQRLMGYAVFGEGEEKIFVIAHGGTNSGKSAFFNNCREFLGQFGSQLNAADVTYSSKSFTDTNNFNLAHIAGARLIYGNRTGQGCQVQRRVAQGAVFGVVRIRSW